MQFTRKYSDAIAMTLLALVWPVATCGQEPEKAKPDPIAMMDKMVGDWVMTGTIGQDEVTHDVDVDWVLKRQYIRIHEVSREKDAQGERAYEAIIYLVWDEENREYAMMWLDNTAPTNFAEEGVGHAKLNGNRLPFVWESEGGGGIRNTFQYWPEKDMWSWSIDNVAKDGTVSSFAKLELKRKS